MRILYVLPIALAFVASGCGLFPEGTKKPQKPDADVTVPDKKPVDDVNGVAAKLHAALTKDAVPASESRSMWACLEAMATMIEQGEYSDAHVVDVLDLWIKVATQWGWQVGRYTNVSDIVEEEFKKLGDDPALTITDVKSKLITSLRVLGEGFRLGAAGT